MFSSIGREYGASRTTRTRGLRSLSATCAARDVRLSVMPRATFASVPALHGTITMAPKRWLPDAIGAPLSLSLWTSLARPVRAARPPSISVGITRLAPAVTTRWVWTPAAPRTARRSTAYTMPLAPVTATTTSCWGRVPERLTPPGYPGVLDVYSPRRDDPGPRPETQPARPARPRAGAAARPVASPSGACAGRTRTDRSMRRHRRVRRQPAHRGADRLRRRGRAHARHAGPGLPGALGAGAGGGLQGLGPACADGRRRTGPRPRPPSYGPTARPRRTSRRWSAGSLRIRFLRSPA